MVRPSFLSLKGVFRLDCEVRVNCHGPHHCLCDAKSTCSQSSSLEVNQHQLRNTSPPLETLGCSHPSSDLSLGSGWRDVL